MLQWPRQHLPASIRYYRRAIDHYRTGDPETYAAICKGMALAHRQLAEYEAPEKNLHDAMEGFQCALTVYTLQSHPFEFAVAHNNMGAVELTLAGGKERQRRLEAAVDHFTSALKGFSPAQHRLDAAFAYSNLGLAYAGLAEFTDRDKRLSQAIRAFDAASALIPPGSQPKLAAVIKSNRLQVAKTLKTPALPAAAGAATPQKGP
jgi:tetratricopeptide (TPR) repeat protein